MDGRRNLLILSRRERLHRRLALGLSHGPVLELFAVRAWAFPILITPVDQCWQVADCEGLAQAPARARA
jgi:hypothetical protein